MLWNRKSRILFTLGAQLTASLDRMFRQWQLESTQELEICLSWNDEQSRSDLQNSSKVSGTIHLNCFIGFYCRGKVTHHLRKLLWLSEWPKLTRKQRFYLKRTWWGQRVISDLNTSNCEDWLRKIHFEPWFGLNFGKRALISKCIRPLWCKVINVRCCQHRTKSLIRQCIDWRIDQVSSAIVTID